MPMHGNPDPQISSARYEREENFRTMERGFDRRRRRTPANLFQEFVPERERSQKEFDIRDLFGEEKKSGAGLWQMEEPSEYQGGQGRRSFYTDRDSTLFSFDPTGDTGGGKYPGRPSFTFEQDGWLFGSGTLEDQAEKASEFDPAAAFEFGGSRFAPRIEQGTLSFALSSPTALRKLGTAAEEAKRATDPGTLSPNARANQPLMFRPESAARRARSRTLPLGPAPAKARLRRPRLSGY